MANFILTPLMNLPNPVPGLDPGPDYANNLQASLNILDQHNHSSGSGNQVNPSGIDVNTDLAFNLNNATLLRSARFSPQLTPLALPPDLGCLYVSGVDLFYNDVSGTQIQITSAGGVNATSSGISSGTATAAFAGGVLVVDSAANTPANIQGGSLLLGNNVANSKFLTLSPPSAMGANYSLVLPALPASTQFVTLDTSGNLATATSVQGAQIAAGSIQAAQIAPNSLSDTEIVAGGIGTVSLAAGSVTPAKLSTATTASTTWSTTNTTSSATISGGSTSITASGLRPINISISSTVGGISFSNNQSGTATAGATLAVTATGHAFTLPFEAVSGDTSFFIAAFPIAYSWTVPPPSAGSFGVTMTLTANAPNGGVTSAQLVSGILTITEL